jgi:hypothetical protein
MAPVHAGRPAQPASPAANAATPAHAALRRIIYPFADRSPDMRLRPNRIVWVAAIRLELLFSVL